MAVADLDTLLTGTGGTPSWRQAVRPWRVALVAAAAAAVVVVAHPSPRPFLDALAGAEPGWLAVGAGAEVVSIAGYVALLALVARLDLPTSYRITVGGAAVTRVLPTAGAGGVAFSAWALRRAGRDGWSVLLPFLVLLYAVFLLALLGAGVMAAADGLGAWPLLPAGLAAAAIATAAGLGVREKGALGRAVRVAARTLRGGDARLLGALAWWAFDVAVLGTTLTAVGAAPAVDVLLLAYFLGAVGNTVPLPGAQSGGMIGVLVALHTPVGAAVAGVLAYRAIAVWLPLPFGAAALAALRPRK